MPSNDCKLFTFRIAFHSTSSNMRLSQIAYGFARWRSESCRACSRVCLAQWGRNSLQIGLTPITQGPWRADKSEQTGHVHPLMLG